MVEIIVTDADIKDVPADLIAVGVYQGTDVSKAPKGPDAVWFPLLKDLLDSGDFRGRYKEFRVLRTRGSMKSPRVMLLGMGKDKEFLLDSVRELGARAALSARDLRLRSSAIQLPKITGLKPDAIVAALAEGVVMGLFEYREYKVEPTEPEEKRVPVERFFVLAPRGGKLAPLRAAAADAVVAADHVNLARTLIMRPSIAKPPEVLAKVAQAEARKAKVASRVLGPEELRKLGLNALLGVGAGSAKPPRLVVLEFKGGGKRKVLLCGKGITFDSGGISIKPADGMDRMKYDMAGSATVLATILAAARLRLKTNIVAIMAIAENMPSGSAIRPGDVLRAFNGKTIEVANTDAEGRLVLADALSYGVAKHRPDVVVDVATLTGAARVALGSITTCIIGSDDAVVDGLIQAGRRTGDDLWRLPLNKAYERQVQSDIAELRNTGIGGSAGAIAGAAFLKAFVDGKPWAHLDIAGTCWTDKGGAELQKEYLPKGATGIGVRLLLEWLRRP